MSHPDCPKSSFRLSKHINAQYRIWDPFATLVLLGSSQFYVNKKEQDRIHPPKRNHQFFLEKWWLQEVPLLWGGTITFSGASCQTSRVHVGPPRLSQSFLWRLGLGCMPFTHWSTIYSIFSKVGFARSFLCSFSHISWFHSKLHEINIHTPTHNYIKLDVHEVLECKDTSPAFWTRSSCFYETRTRTTKLSQTPRASWWAGTQSGSAFDKNCDHSFVACSRLQMLHALL